MDLVDKENVVRLQVRQQRGEIPGPGDHRSSGRAKTNSQLTRDNLSERGLSQAGRPDEKYVVQCFTARPRLLDENP